LETLPKLTALQLARSLNCRSQTRKTVSKPLPGEKSLPTPYGFKIQTDAAWSGVESLEFCFSLPKEIWDFSQKI